MTRVFLGLGTNLGDRERNLREALRRLADLVAIDAVSTVYRSEPVGYREQPDFWNLVVDARTALEPADLLSQTQRVERELGRRDSFRDAPRPIDIDILLYADRALTSSELELPHPRMLERGFVLRPLSELAPSLRHPRTGRTIAEHLDAAAGLERTEPLYPGDRLLDREGTDGGGADAD